MNARRSAVFVCVCGPVHSRVRWAVAVVLLACVPVVSGELPPAADLQLAAVVDAAVRENPDLRSLRAKREASLEQPAQAAALPDPMLVYGAMDMVNGGTWPDTNEKRIMLEQELPGFGKRGLREQLARKDAEAMQWELESMTRDVVMRVKETYFELFAVQKVMAVTHQDETVLQRTVKIAETMYSTGERNQQDVLKAKSEITLLKQRMFELEARENTLKATLNALLNRRADAPLGAAVTPPAGAVTGTLDALLALAATNRPEIRATEVQSERYDLERRLKARESVPDYTLGVEYRNIGDRDDMVMFTIGVDLPIWQTKYRAGVREAERMQTSGRADREAAERRSARDIQDAYFKLQTARRTVDLYRTDLIPQAEARFTASETAYQTGKVDFMDLLESQRFLLSARVMAAMAEGEIGMQAARLERAVGIDLTTSPEQGGNRK